LASFNSGFYDALTFSSFYFLISDGIFSLRHCCLWEGTINAVRASETAWATSDSTVALHSSEVMPFMFNDISKREKTMKYAGIIFAYLLKS